MAPTLVGELGLHVAYLDPIGWSATSVPVHFQRAKGSVLASHHQQGREEQHRDGQRWDN